jgi:hypothetical protein
VIEHRQEFQRELEVIDAKVTGLFAMVADGLPSATYALLSGNNEVLGALAEREQVIAPCTGRSTTWPAGRSCCKRRWLQTCVSCCR